MERRDYAIVGLGGRHAMFRDAITRTYTETAGLVALCDSNPGRLALSRGEASPDSGARIPGYLADDFDRMVAETRPDVVIVTTRDSAHDVYICRAMELGCDVITEKPMTIDAGRCLRILEAQKRTGRKVTVTFNYRYAPPRSQVKELLMSGVIGDILSVDFEWLLDISHGADYFRRWHRNKAHSGGLLVHKATHHFDLVNWWLSSVPERVSAMGHRRFYVPKTADRLGLANRGERCHGCPEADRCGFVMRLDRSKAQKALYLDCETYDGYYRDRCVFSPDIDIEDSMSVQAGYASGALLTYSLNAFCAAEGYHVVFNGTRGRLEHKCEETSYTNADGSVPGALRPEGTWTRVYPMRAPAYQVELPVSQGGHGGADPVMLGYIFDPDAQPADPLMRAADQRAGAYSISIGLAANQSMATGRPVAIASLLPGLELPDYPVFCPYPGARDVVRCAPDETDGSTV